VPDYPETGQVIVDAGEKSGGQIDAIFRNFWKMLRVVRRGHAVREWTRPCAGCQKARMSLSTGALSRECRAALSRAFMLANPHCSFAARGYMSDPRQNLVEGVRFEDVEGDILQGDGSELRGSASRPPKFLAAHSSTALAVNVFGPCKRDPSAVRVPWGGSFTGLHFEKKCPHGVGNGRPPTLTCSSMGRAGLSASSRSA